MRGTSSGVPHTQRDTFSLFHHLFCKRRARAAQLYFIPVPCSASGREPALEHSSQQRTGHLLHAERGVTCRPEDNFQGGSSLPVPEPRDWTWAVRLGSKHLRTLVWEASSLPSIPIPAERTAKGRIREAFPPQLPCRALSQAVSPCPGCPQPHLRYVIQSVKGQCPGAGQVPRAASSW